MPKTPEASEDLESVIWFHAGISIAKLRYQVSLGGRKKVEGLDGDDFPLLALSLQAELHDLAAPLHGVARRFADDLKEPVQLLGAMGFVAGV